MPRLSTVALILLTLTLAACVDTPPPPQAKALSFAQYAPITLDVADVQVNTNYRSPLAAPNVEHLFPTPPAEAMKIWVRDRIRPVGMARRLEVNIIDASVKEVPLERTKGIKGAFTKDQAKRFDARMEVEMRIYGTSPLSEASLNVIATRSQTLAEDASPAARDAVFDRMTAELMTSVNAELEKNIYQYFSNYATGGF